MSSPEATTRREFARRMALLAAGVPLASCATAAPPAPVPRAPAPPVRSSESGEEPRPVADSLHAIVRRRYGEQLSREQLAEVREDIESYLGWAEAMREVELQNSDGLACGVGAYRGGA